MLLGQSPQLAPLALVDVTGEDEIVALPQVGGQRCERRDQVAYVLPLIETPRVQDVTAERSRTLRASRAPADRRAPTDETHDLRPSR